MTNITTTDVFNGTLTNADTMNSNFQAVRTVVNGNIDNANLHSSAAIERTKLATVTRKYPVSLHNSPAGQPQLAAAGTTLVTWTFHVPDDYVSGDITIKLLIQGDATEANTAVLRRTLWRYRDAVAFTVIDSAVNVNQSNFTVNVQITLSSTLAAANFQAGDLFEVELSRLGGDAGDTFTSTVTTNGGWIEYTGRA